MTRLYQSIVVNHPPYSIGIDATDRVMYSTNYSVRVTGNHDGAPFDVRKDLADQALQPTALLGIKVQLDPNDRVTTYSRFLVTGGQPAEITHNVSDPNTVYSFSVQVLTYGPTDDSAKLLADTIHTHLNATFNLELDD